MPKTEQLNKQLIEALRPGTIDNRNGASVETIRDLLKQGAAPDCIDTNCPKDMRRGYNYRGIHYVSFCKNENSIEILLLLMQYGADINAVADRKITALHLAAFYDRESHVRLLLQHGANVNAQDDGGRTALAFAVRRKCKREDELTENNLGTVKLLIAATLLKNPSTAQPPFDDFTDNPQSAWNSYIGLVLPSDNFKCMRKAVVRSWHCIDLEIIKMKNEKIPGTEFSFYDVCKEENRKKLADMCKDPETRSALQAQATDIKLKFPHCYALIMANFHKGTLEGRALMPLCVYNKYNENGDTCLPEDLWIKIFKNADLWRNILQYLPEEDVRNVAKVSYLFFKAPSPKVEKTSEEQPQNRTTCSIPLRT